jgi:hypothetical protein
MRINVYNEEITNEIKIVWVEPRPGVRYCGVRFFLKSHEDLHHTENDDDRSAITFWLGSPLKAAIFFDHAIVAASDEMIRPTNVV